MNNNNNSTEIDDATEHNRRQDAEQRVFEGAQTQRK